MSYCKNCNNINVSLLNFLDFDGLATRFLVGDDMALLIVMPDGLCILRSYVKSDSQFYLTFHSLDFAMNYIVDMATLDSIRENGLPL